MPFGCLPAPSHVGHHDAADDDDDDDRYIRRHRYICLHSFLLSLGTRKSADFVEDPEKKISYPRDFQSDSAVLKKDIILDPMHVASYINPIHGRGQLHGGRAGKGPHECEEENS